MRRGQGGERGTGGALWASGTACCIPQCWMTTIYMGRSDGEDLCVWVGGLVGGEEGGRRVPADSRKPSKWQLILTCALVPKWLLSWARAGGWVVARMNADMPRLRFGRMTCRCTNGSRGFPSAVVVYMYVSMICPSLGQASLE